MKIVSKFHDYYDSVQAYGIDEACFYKRNTEEFKKDTKEFKIIEDLIKVNNNLLRGKIKWFMLSETPFRVSNYYVLFFCGKVYPVLQFRHMTRKSINYYYYYSLEELEVDFKKWATKTQKKWWPKTKQVDYWNRTFQRYHAEERLSKTVNNNTVNDLHFELNSPIILYDEYSDIVLTNPRLADIKFFKVKDVFTTYQDLGQFISGVLGGQCPITVELSDKIRSQKHGFNEWSFRTPPK